MPALIAAAVLMVGLAVSGWAYATGRIFSRAFTATGVISVVDGTGRTPDAVCSVTGTYPDIQTGTQVIITDAASKTVAIGALDAGIGGDNDECEFRFSVPDVPSGLGFYGVEVAHRGSSSPRPRYARAPPSRWVASPSLQGVESSVSLS